jgi:amidase
VPNSYRLTADQFAVSFDRTLVPALEIDSGDMVSFETADVAYERLSKGESVEAIGLANFNRVTGPVFVRGAEAGDALKVEVLDVQVRRAWSVWLPDFGGLGAFTQDIGTREIPIRDGYCHISDTLKVPVAPMIGCIGVAPAEGSGSTFMPAYPFGGNMDLREMQQGTTVYLPVQVSGALLAMGDLHAAMGIAEPTWVSLEAAGEATLRISVVKQMPLAYPRLRVGTSTYFLGMNDDYKIAHQIALDAAFAYLTGELGMSAFDAYAYASARIDMRLGGPATVVVMAVVPDP